ncbi:MAG: TetR/AcrR family transcriptional regulator [Solirubrobacteraceae bacterium]
MSTRQAKATKARIARPRLTRERVLVEALRLIDDEGLDALTMRALGNRLGVEAMSIYNHVADKAALRAGIVELLWEELERSVEEGEDWRDSLRSLARRERALATDHPNAFPLLMGASSWAEPMLRTLGRALDVLRHAGFDDERAAKILNTVLGYACGYATMEISYLGAGRSRLDGTDELEWFVEFARALPPGAPPELVRVARDCCMLDPDEQFEFGLEALLAGLDPGCETWGA